MRSRSPSSLAKNASGAAEREKSPKKADRPTLRDGIDMPEVVRRYLDGESIPALAKENRVARRTMYRYVLAECGGERYREVVTEALVSRIADADEELENAARSQDPVRVTAAKETCKYVRTDFERRRPALYGQKQLNVNVHELTVNAGLVGDLGEMLNSVKRHALPAPKDVDDAEEVGG